MQITVDRAKEILNEICAKKNAHYVTTMQGIEGERLHALNVLQWVEKFSPNASIALQIAALFHDIDRVVNPKWGGGYKGERDSRKYLNYKKRHASRSANFIAPILVENGFPQDLIERIIFLILHHDDSGENINHLKDQELDQLVAADSFAFFTSIAPKLLTAEGIARVRDKTRFMINKMPEKTRESLWEYHFDDNTFETIKNEIICEYYMRNGLREGAYKYCPTCAKRLKRKLIDEQQLLSCGECGFVYWNPPFPVTSVVLEINEKILLLRRAAEPLKGYWCLPGGYIRYTEKPEAAAIREVKEETGLDISIRNIVGVYQIDNDPRGVNLDIIWTGLLKDGYLQTNNESTEAGCFDKNNLPTLIAYKHRQAIFDADKLKGLLKKKKNDNGTEL